MKCSNKDVLMRHVCKSISIVKTPTIVALALHMNEVTQWQ